MENFITSKKFIKEILKTSPQYISKLYVANNAFGSDIKEIIELAKKKKISFLSVPKQKILEVFNQGYSGLLLVLSPIRYWSLEEFLNRVSSKDNSLILALDKINDPHNFGAILRSVAAFEVDGVIIQQWNQVSVTQTVVEVSRGGAYKVPIIKVKNIYNALKKLKEQSFWIFSTGSLSGVSKEPITDLDKISEYKKICVILGNEAEGVRKNLISESDGVVTIKHSTNMESLNVSVACGIILYEIYKSRNKERIELL